MLDNHMIGGCNMYEKQDGRDNQNYDVYTRKKTFHQIRSNAMEGRHHMKDATNIALPS